MSGSGHGFRRRTIESLATPGLKQKSMHNAWTGHTKRAEAAAGVSNWQELRERAKQVKRHTLDHLDEYLEQLAGNVEKNGGHVCFAATGEEAVRYIAEVAQRHGAGSLVKAKSMASEELHLNAELEELGMRPVETDLGEYILQLADERPSHIITPVIHKSRQDVGEIFSQALGVDYTDDPQELAALARARLRREFLTAPVGFSGGNFLVAETGTLVLVENEGNIRLSTTLPRVHIALVGMEKVIPRFDDLGVFLQLLPRCGTGQQLSGYVSLISGPRREDDLDGPEEFHLVLLDNGRSKLLADPLKRQILSCIRCGACLNACPVYRTVCGLAYDAVYPGPIGKLLGPHAIGTEHGDDLPLGSSLCGCCSEVCPVKIDIAHLLLHLRREYASGRHGGLAWDFGFEAWAAVTSEPAAYRVAAAAAKLGKRALDATHTESLLPPPLSGWTNTRRLPPFAKRSFDQWWRDTEGGTKDG